MKTLILSELSLVVTILAVLERLALSQSASCTLTVRLTSSSAIASSILSGDAVDRGGQRDAAWLDHRRRGIGAKRIDLVQMWVGTLESTPTLAKGRTYPPPLGEESGLTVPPGSMPAGG